MTPSGESVARLRPHLSASLPRPSIGIYFEETTFDVSFELRDGGCDPTFEVGLSVRLGDRRAKLLARLIPENWWRG